MESGLNLNLQSKRINSVMLTNKKTLLTVLTLILLSFSTNLMAQQSDYEIVQDFRAAFAELNNEIDLVIDIDELELLSRDLNAFESRFSEHSSLIDGALYPDTFATFMNELRVNYDNALANLSVIEQLNERIDQMVQEMDVFRNRITSMNQEIVSLEEQIDRSTANESQQAALIRQYRQNLNQRDTFVSNFLEELVARYRNMDPTVQAEYIDASERLQDNPVGILQTILTEYIEIANRATNLELPDYVGMRAQHGYFSSVWDRIGTQLTQTFNPDNAQAERQEIDDLLVAWLNSIDVQLWDSLADAFYQNGIELPPFTNSSEFNLALNNYVDTAYEISLESNRDADYQVYRNFSEFWNNTVKASWGELLTTGNILTYSEIAAIDVKLSSWGEAASPTSNLMFILLIVSIAVIVGLVVLLVTKKS